ncbi:gypsy type transposase, partial [Tanacetum coccineum]
ISILPFGNGKYESNDSTIRYGALCARKHIQVTNVLLIDADVSKALVDYVSENEIENLVLGASTRNGITRSATISQRSAPDMIMPHIRDAYETPSLVYFGSVDLVGHDLDVNFMGHSNENRTLASSSPHRSGSLYGQVSTCIALAGQEVHPQLPGPDDTMHERPAGKVGMYTRLFDYANYRIPFSNFFVSVLIHFRIPFSQLSILGSAKIGKEVEMDLNAFIRTADPRKVRIVERARAENEEPIVTVAKHRTVTPLPTSVVRPSGDLSESVEREFGGDVSGSAGRGQEDASVGGYSDAEPIVPVTAGVAAETGSSRAKRPKKKRVVHESGDTPAASHPPKRLRADYGNTSGSVIGASPLEEGGGHTDSAIASALCTVGPSERFVVLSDSSHYSSAKSADAEFNVSAARNLSLSSEVRMRAEYNILEKRKWRSLAEERNDLLQHKGLLEQERSALNLKVTSLESTIAEKDRELSDLETSSSSLRSHNQRLVRELETSSASLCEKLETYEGSMKQLEEFQDNLMKPLEARLAEIDADFTRVVALSQEVFHPHLPQAVSARRRWLLAHGMRLLMAKCLNSSEYMEALENAFGRATEKGMKEGLAAGIEHGQAGRCLNDLEANKLWLGVPNVVCLLGHLSMEGAEDGKEPLLSVVPDLKDYYLPRTRHSPMDALTAASPTDFY